MTYSEVSSVNMTQSLTQTQHQYIARR